MSCEERAWLTNQPGVSSCTHVFVSGFGRPQLRSRVKEARPLYFVSTETEEMKMKKVWIVAMLTAVVALTCSAAVRWDEYGTWTDRKGIVWKYRVCDITEVGGPTASIRVPGGAWIEGVENKDAVSGTLVIPGEINGHPVIQIGDSAFCDSTAITSVSFPSKLRVIATGAFCRCTNLAEVELPKSLCVIGGSAFGGCSSLSNVKFNEGLETIEGYAFSYCIKLMTVSLPHSLRNLKSSAFVGSVVMGTVRRNGFTMIDDWVVDWDGSGKPNVTLPSGCRGLATGAFLPTSTEFTLTFPEGFECVSSGALSGDLMAVTEISFPSTLRWIGNNAFRHCLKLKGLHIPAGDIGEYIFDDYRFGDARTELGGVVIGDHGKIVSTKLTLGEGVTSVGKNAFSSLWSSRYIKIPNSVTNFYASSFEGSWVGDRPFVTLCEGNTNFCVEVKDDVTALYRIVGGVKKTLIDVTDSRFENGRWQDPIPPARSFEVPATVTVIQDGALDRFSSPDRDFSIKLPKNVAVNEWVDSFCSEDGICTIYQDTYTKDGVVWSYLVNGDGVKLTAASELKGMVIVPDQIDGMPVTQIGECVFLGCPELTDLTFGEHLVCLDSAFGDCTSLKTMRFKGRDPMSYWAAGAAAGAPEDMVVYAPIDGEGWSGYVEEGQTEGEWNGHRLILEKSVRHTTLVPGEAVLVETGLIGYKATGLPSGLKYDAKTGKITGAATKPTADDGVAVKFTKKGEEDVVLTFVVGPIPTLKVDMEGDVDGCKVTGTGAYLVGKKVTLKVTTKKGTAFLGYYKGEEPWPNEADYKKTSLSYVMTRDDVSVVAKFEKEKMSVGCTGLEGYFVAGVAGAAEGIPLQIETQSGVKSVKVTKLPAGMKYDSKTGRITGAPTKAENPTVVIEVTAVSGAVEKKEIPVRVIAPIEKAVGLFSGFATKDSLRQFDRVGTILLTTTAAGKLTAKVVTKKGSLSFSAASWDGIRDSYYENDGVYFVTMKTKKGEELSLELDTRYFVGIGVNQLTGWLKGVDAEDLRIGAQHVVFGQPWYFTAVGDEDQGWKLSYTADKKVAALTVTFKADGSVTIAGKLGNCKVSASGYASVSDLSAELLRADFAIVVKAGKVSRMLNVNTNLRFDRTYVQDEAGEAAFAE